MDGVKEADMGSCRVYVTTGAVLLTFLAAGSIMAKEATICPKLRECPKKACGKGQYRQGEILVKFKKDVSKEEIAALNKQLGAEVVKYFHHTEAYLLKLPAGMEVKEAVKLYQERPEVEYAEPNYQAGIDLIEPK